MKIEIEIEPESGDTIQIIQSHKAEPITFLFDFNNELNIKLTDLERIVRFFRHNMSDI